MSDPNYARCLRVTFKNGVGLRQAPCRDSSAAVAAVAPTGSVLCASSKNFASSCGEPYTYTYVAYDNRYTGYVLSYDAKSSTAFVVPCLNV
jgi:hypothetical protein